MTIFVALLLAVLTFAVVIMPFFRQRLRPIAAFTDENDERSQELLFKRDTTYAMLKELELDFQSGILTREDYRDLEDRYKRKGISILKDIDSLPAAAVEKRVGRLRQKPSVDISDEIEARITSLRKRKSGDIAGEIEDKISSLRRNKGQFCSQCGAKHRPDARFCVQCGAKLS